MADVESIVIAVRAVPDLESARAAADALMQQATQRAGGGPAGGGPAPAAAGGMAGGSVAQASVSSPQITSMQAVTREWQALIAISRSLGMHLTQLIHLLGQMPATGRAPTPPTGPPPPPLAVPPGLTPPAAGTGLTAAPVAPPPGAQPPGAGGAAQGMQVNERFVRDLLAGAAGVAGVGLGMRAVFSDVASMVTQTRSLQEETFRAGLTTGNLADAGTLHAQFLAGPGYRTLTGPVEQARALTAFRQQGTDASPEDLAAIGDLGIAGLGSSQAGYGFAQGMYRDTRTSPTKSLELLGSMSEYGLRTSQGVGELLNEFQSMNRALTSLGGTRAVGDREMDDRARAFTYLRSLPGGIGEGEGATRIAQGLTGAAQGGGMAQDIAAVNYERHTGHSAWESPLEWHRFQLYQRGAAVEDRQLPGGIFYQDQIEGFQRRFGKDAAGWMDVAGGLTPEETEELRKASPDGRRQIWERIQARETRRLMAERSDRFAETAGGESILARTDEERGASGLTGPAAAQVAWQRFKGQHPYEALGVEGVGGTVLGTLTNPWAGATIGTLALGGLAGRSALGGAAGRAATMATRGFSLLGPALGVAAAGYDAYGAATTGDYGPIVAGTIAAVPGAMYGGPQGAALGYSLGSGAYRLGEGFLEPEPARAAVREEPPAGTAVEQRSMAGILTSGWERSEVAEHLQLMRELVHPAWTGGGGTQEQFRDEWPLPDAGPKAQEQTLDVPAGRGRLSPDDPRIAAAAERHNLPLPLVQAVIRAESQFRVGLTSPQGARGLMQVIDATGDRYGKNAGSRYDIEENLEDGTAYLRHLIDRYKSVDTAVLAYHQGEGNVDKGTIGPKGRAYRARVARFTQHYQERAESQATERKEREERERQALLDRNLGPDAAAPSDDVYLHMVPGTELQGILQPRRIPMPGVLQRTGR